MRSREVVHISTYNSASADLTKSEASSGDGNSEDSSSSGHDGGDDPSTSGYDGDDSDALSSPASSVSPNDVVGGVSGPPDFVARLDEDEPSRYNKPSIRRDTSPIYMRYRKK